MEEGIQPEKLRIVLFPDPVLRAGCRPVTVFDERLEAVARRMLHLMREAAGIGLAGPQVGLAWRMFVCNPTSEPGKELVVVNPELSDHAGLAEMEEGCLSLPDVAVTMRRAVSVRLRAFDVSGKPFERVGKDMEARVWQHETDHLDGRLIIDSMSEAEKISNRRALKQLRSSFKQSA